jgi:hypothetical protein
MNLTLMDQQPSQAYVGIDLAIAKSKRLPIVIARWMDDRLVPLRLRDPDGPLPPKGPGNVATVLDPGAVRAFVEQAASYVETVAARHGLRIRRIAIDAPSDYRSPDLSRRAAEVAMDRAGIRCFTTPSRDDFDLIRARVEAHLRAGGPGFSALSSVRSSSCRPSAARSS